MSLHEYSATLVDAAQRLGPETTPKGQPRSCASEPNRLRVTVAHRWYRRPVAGTIIGATE